MYFIEIININSTYFQIFFFCKTDVFSALQIPTAAGSYNSFLYIQKAGIHRNFQKLETFCEYRLSY